MSSTSHGICSHGAPTPAEHVNCNTMNPAPTQQFHTAFPLQHTSLTFIPCSNWGYAVCVQHSAQLPDPPSGAARTLSLSDDRSAAIDIGASFTFFGQTYTSLHVGSNGYITFGSGDTDYSESLSDHFSQPRISALFDDLNPSVHGAVHYEVLDSSQAENARLVVTWNGVAEHGTSNTNTFQVAMYLATGWIRVSWGDVAVIDTVVGLSAGATPASFQETDFRAAATCGVRYQPHACADSTTFTFALPREALLGDQQVYGCSDLPRLLAALSTNEWYGLTRLMDMEGPSSHGDVVRRCKQDRDVQLAGAAMAFGAASDSVPEVARVLGIKRMVVTTGQVGHQTLQAGIGLGLAARRSSGLLKGLVTEAKTKLKDITNAEVAQKVMEFWLSPGITRVSTCKRDVIQVRHENGTVEKASKQWLEMTQLEVFQLEGGQRAVLSNRKPTAADPEKVCGRCEIGASTSKFVASLLCPKPTMPDGEPAEFHAMRCLDQSCEVCGGLQNFKLCEAEIAKAGQEVEWSTYESKVVGLDEEGNNKHRVQFVQKHTPVGELVSKLQGCLLGHVPGESKNCLCSGKFVQKAPDTDSGWAVKELDGVGGRPCPFLKPYAYHCFMAQHSMNMFNKCKENLPLGHCLLLFDFSENHALNIPRAIQSLHWIVKQASLLCCVLWRHAVKEVDGVESTEENPIIVKDYLYFMGDNMSHSHRSIQHMRKLIVKEYFQKRGIPLPKFIHEWADGSAAQNKCATAFADVVESGRPMEWVRGLGIWCQRNFFETSHGRTHEDGDVDVSGPGFNTVDGTLALHSVRAGVGLMVGLKRDRQCYCDYCYAQCEKPQPDSEGCHYKSHVDEWVPFTLVEAAVGGERRTRIRAAEHAHEVAQVEVSRGSIFARPSGGDELHPYYLVKALGGVHQVLDADGIKDDYYTPGEGGRAGAGVHATPGEFVVEGRFLEWRDDNTCTEYFVDNSMKCLTYSKDRVWEPMVWRVMSRV
ncbi:hypothetical protein CYMTET_13785 [Cymbomonas tetramitiformis]|uniref:Uncharacterized protein n=1 Tax=Cymbomonas tetramitiformis TaxID=36881 RepID=A0AAE0LB17_9CHLO|nr:hypothetical protein CYMTET_13785 [Cymbomonas tetramitiformis]